MNSRDKKAILVAGGFALGVAFAVAEVRRHIDRRWPLRPAIDATRRALVHPRGGRISCYEDTSASGGAVPVLLIHGVHPAASAYEVRPLFDALRGHRPVFAPDLPGFGFSERSEREYSRSLYVDVIAELIDRLSAERGPVDVVAVGLSCELTARAALEARGRSSAARSLTLVAPTGFERRAPRGAKHARARHRVLASRPVAQPLYDAITSRSSLRRARARSFVGPIDEELAEYEYATSHQPDARHAPLWFMSGALSDPKIRGDVYEALPMPVHVLYDREPHLSFDELERTVRRCVTWRATRIPSTRGLPHFERRDETLAAMADFYGYVDELTEERPTLELGGTRPASQSA